MATYEITKVDASYRTWQAKKGPAAGQDFHSYNVSAKGPDGEEHDYEISRKPTSGPPPLGAVEAEVQPSNGSFPDKLKLTPQGRAGGFSGGSQGKDDYWAKREQRDVESQARMGRAHAQEMALRALGFRLNRGDVDDEGLQSLITLWTDWFHADVQRFPEEEQRPETDPAVRGQGEAGIQPAPSTSSEPPSSAQKSKITQLLNKNVAMEHHADLKAQATSKKDATELISRLIKVDGGERDVNALLKSYGITPQSDLPWSDD